jgi:hypothetical protein
MVDVEKSTCSNYSDLNCVRNWYLCAQLELDGFKANDTVWDWLQLLLLPIALAAVPIWLIAEEGQQRMWLAQLKWVFLASVVILAVLFIGTYAFNWFWTGFKDHGTLWDWLSLLLVPVTVAALPIWYSIRQSPSNSDSIQHEIG